MKDFHFDDESVVKRFDELREKVYNKTIHLFLIFALIPIIIVVGIGWERGFVFGEYVDFAIYGLFVILTIMRHRLPLKILVLPCTIGLVLLSLNTILYLGFSSISVVFLIGGCLFSYFYYGRRIGLLTVLSGTMAVLSLIILHLFEIIDISCKYADNALSNACSMMASIVLVFLVVRGYIYQANSMMSLLQDFVREINHRAADLHESNILLNEEIKKHKSADNALKLSEDRFRRLFDTATDAILIINDECKIIDCNRQFEILYRAPKKYVIGRDILNLSTEKQYNVDSSEKLHEVRRNLDIDSNYFTRWTFFSYEKNVIETEVSLNMISNNEDQLFAQAIIRDITERVKVENELALYKTKLEEMVRERTIEIENVNKELLVANEEMQCFNDILEKENKIREQSEQELIRMQNELQKSNDIKNKIFSIIAHDLKNPFNLIINFSELLSGRMGIYPDEKKQKFIEYINTTAKQGYDLLKNLLLWTTSQINKIDFNQVKCNLVAVVTEAIQVVKSAKDNKLIDIQIEIPENCSVFADEEMLKAIFRNLISNSIKYTNNGGVIKVFAEEMENDIIKICISDSGVGMTDVQIANLFSFAGRTKSTKGTNGEEGTGFGLLLCKEFVEKNGGKIWVESEIQKGSKFYFELKKFVD